MFGVGSIQDFVQFEILPIRDFVQCETFVHSGFCPFQDFAYLKSLLVVQNFKIAFKSVGAIISFL